MEVLAQQIVNGLVLGAIFALLACGINLIYAETKMLWFAYTAMPPLGSLLALSTITVLDGALPALGGGPRTLLAFAIAAGLSAMLSRVLGTAFWRHLRGADRVSQVAASIAAGLVITALTMLVWGRAAVPFPELFSIEPIAVGGALVTQFQIALVGGTAVLLTLLSTKHSRRKPAPATETEQAASRRVGGAFALSGVLGAAAGMAFGVSYAAVSVHSGSIVLAAIIAACIGGLGSLPGAIGASLAVGLVTTLGAGYIGDVTEGALGSHHQDLFPLLLLVLYLYFRRPGTARATQGPALPSAHSRNAYAFDRAGGVFTLLALLALLPVVATQLGLHALLRVLTVMLPMMAIVLGIAYMLGRAGTPEPGYMAYPMLGGYTYALLASGHPLALSAPDAGASLALYPPWAALLAGLLAAAALAAALYRAAGAWPLEYRVVLSLASYEALLLLAGTLDITNGPDGIAMIPPLWTDRDGAAVPLAAFYTGLFAVAAIVAAMTAARPQLLPGDKQPRRIPYIMGAAFGGLAGGMSAAANGFLGPADFPSTLWLAAFAFIVLARGGTVARLLLVVLLILPTTYSAVPDLVQQDLFGRIVVDHEILFQLLAGSIVLALTVFRYTHGVRLEEPDGADSLYTPQQMPEEPSLTAGTAVSDARAYRALYLDDSPKRQSLMRGWLGTFGRSLHR